MIVKLIVLLNVAVWFAWFNSDSSLDGFMGQNFLVSWSALQDGRLWTLLTAAFSHNMLWHLALNMYVLMGFGSVLEQLLGSWRFLRFYVVAGIFSSFFHAAVSAFLMGEPQMPALGASGAICGVVLVFSLLFPQEKILLFGIIPVPALMGALLLIGLDVWGLVAQSRGGGLPIGHGAHIGGAIAGIIYFFMLRRKLRRSSAAVF